MCIFRKPKYTAILSTFIRSIIKQLQNIIVFFHHEFKIFLNFFWCKLGRAHLHFLVFASSLTAESSKSLTLGGVPIMIVREHNEFEVNFLIIFIPHLHSSSSFLIFIPHLHSSSSFLIFIPHLHSSSSFLIFIPHLHSSSSFLIFIPHLHSSSSFLTFIELFVVVTFL